MDALAQDILATMRSYALPGPLTNGVGTQLRQRGEIRLGRRWFQFKAEEHMDAVSVGFRWNARVRVAPFVSIAVADYFVNGRGGLKVRLLGVPLASATGPELNVGEAPRFLAELPWCPLAFGNPSLEWSSLDQGTVRVSLLEGTNPVSVIMRIDDSGRVLRCEAKRPRQVGKQFVLADWFGEFADYQAIGGMRMPSRGEASWVLPEETLTYWRGEVVDAGIIR